MGVLFMKINTENLMKTAIKEMENGQHSEAAKHFDMVVINDSTNIDAPLFRAYCNCHDIKLGEMPNVAIGFTNAFYQYVDDVKALNDPTVEKEKLDYAVNLLSELVSLYKLNANRQILTPTLGMSISTAAMTMNQKCINKLKAVNANVSSKNIQINENLNKSNVTAGVLLGILAVLGAIAFVVWMNWGIFF